MPIAQLPRKLTITVAVSAAGNGMPACDKIPGLTTMMYIAVRKVVMPATISVFVREPDARMPKNRSMLVVSLVIVAIAQAAACQYASSLATIASRSAWV